MMIIEFLESYPTKDYVESNPLKLFVFDSNYNIDCQNTFQFNFTGKDLHSFSDSVIQNIIFLKSKIFSYKYLVLSKVNYGSQIINLPDVYENFNKLMKLNFDYDNINRRKWFKIPSYNDTISSEYVNLSKNDNIIIPPSNTSFRTEYLIQDLYSTFDLVRTENKIAFTSKKDYTLDQNLIFQFNNQKRYLLCRVILAYTVSSVSDENWSLFEGLNTDLVNSFDKSEFKQFHIRFISEIDERGNMIFRNDIFNDSKPQVETETIEVKNGEEISNSDIYNLLLQINSKLDKLLK
jgi:hypothetical protein